MVFRFASRAAYSAGLTRHSFARPNHYKRVIWSAAIAVAGSLVMGHTIHLDSMAAVSANDAITTVDPDTGIEFPKTLRVGGTKQNIPLLSLVGIGVRTVSFLGIKVYSVGFYADLTNSNLKISQDMSPDEKIKEIIHSSACLVRIVPTRNTSYTHLRDAFVRGLSQRLALSKKENTLSEEAAFEVGGPIRQLKSLFPNSPLNKNIPLDVFLSAPTPGQPRTLVFRDLGSIESDWVATEFVLHYFEGAGLSPALKRSTLNSIENFTK
ncbi:chalcone-flavanone isomerase-domain-containing protein [Mycena floridula]|nr:chalcone-flavanone isomerase-domain-containing protein [Mycena floridula]